VYAIVPVGPPTITEIWAAFAGRTAKRPDKAEIAKSLENIISSMINSN
jgi:hypothetical protein